MTLRGFDPDQGRGGLGSRFQGVASFAASVLSTRAKGRQQQQFWWGSGETLSASSAQAPAAWRSPRPLPSAAFRSTVSRRCPMSAASGTRKARTWSTARPISTPRKSCRNIRISISRRSGRIMLSRAQAQDYLRAYAQGVRPLRPHQLQYARQRRPSAIDGRWRIQIEGEVAAALL